MRDDIQSLEPRQMLSAVAAHVVGQTLKIAGTPHNDAIVVALKGKTLFVKANGATSKFAAKGVKLIDVAGRGGKDKVRVTAPIAYRLNGKMGKAPVAPTPTPDPTPNPDPTPASGGTLSVAGGSVLNLGGGSGLTLGGSGTNVYGSTTSGTIAINPNPGSGGFLAGTSFGLGGQTIGPGDSLVILNSAVWFSQVNTIRLAGGASLTVPTIPATVTVQLLTLGAPQITLTGDEATWATTPCAFTLELADPAAVAPGTYPVIRFADSAYMPADISTLTFKSDPLPAEYTYSLVLNAVSRTVDLVIADKPAIDPAVVDPPA